MNCSDDAFGITGYKEEARGLVRCGRTPDGSETSGSECCEGSRVEGRIIFVIVLGSTGEVGEVDWLKADGDGAALVLD